MNYKIVATQTFRREAKRLAKKYHSLKSDLEVFEKELSANPTMGDDLGNNTRKIRIAVTSKNKGKSGGARVITYHLLVDIKNTTIYLLSIYDKSKQENISDSEIFRLKQKNGL